MAGNRTVAGQWLLRGAGTAAVIGVLCLLTGPVGSRAELWSFSTGFMLLRIGAYLGIAAGVVALAGGWLGGRYVTAFFILLAGLLVFGVPWRLMRQARSVPPIHDITTDTENPPAFVEILSLRRDAPNPPAYEGEAVAVQQRRAYPDIQPLILAIPPDRGFARALEAARSQGWEIVAATETEGRIEAVDTTFWFGFKDDVVVRITGADGGSRIDVRSKSRVGRGDVGKNAARIRVFLADLRGT